MKSLRRHASHAALLATVLHVTGCGSSESGAPSPPALGSPAGACDAPQHPFMAPNGSSNIHDDAHMTDTYAWAGFGADAKVVVGALGGECASITMDAKGRLVSVCIATTTEKRAVLLDPRTLEVLASYDKLPKGISSTGFGAGGYFYLDDQSRAVVPTLEGHILRLATSEGPPIAFVVDADWDLTVAGGLTAGDGAIESALPDWSGRIWFVTENGTVGIVDEQGGPPSLVRLPGEKIGNSFAVDETGGVFVVTEEALYRFDADASGAPAITFREAYDRGTGIKPGQVNFGSGTTPTLFGDGWVAITDNAEPRMNVLVYARGKEHAGDRKLCQTPVFDDGASDTENSLIGCGRSLVVENNYGYTGIVFNGTTHPGIARVDVRADASGCDVVWTSRAAAPSAVAKLSVASDAVYTYTKTEQSWFMSSIDFRSGDTNFDIPTGTTVSFNNHYAPVTIAKDGTGYIGIVSGMLAFLSP